MSPVENLVQILFILTLMSLYSFLSILLMLLDCTSLVCMSTYCASSCSNLKSRYSCIWLRPAFLLRRLCQPSTSLFVRTFCIKTDQLAGTKILVVIHVASRVSDVNSPVFWHFRFCYIKSQFFFQFFLF